MNAISNMTQQLPYLAPALLVYLVGIVLSLVYLKRFTTPAVLVLNASMLLFFVTLCLPFIQGYLIGHRNSLGGLDRIIMMVVGVGGSVLRSAAFCLLLVASFVGRSTNSPDYSAAGNSLEPHRAIIVLEFGILSLMFCPPLGIAAWLMGSYDLSAMRAGRMDRSGYSITSVGYILGIIGTVFFGLGIVGAYLWLYGKL